LSRLYKSDYVYIGEPLEIAESLPDEQDEPVARNDNLALDMESIKKEAERTIQEARKTAAEIIKGAEDEAKVILKRAAEEGYEKGYRDGLQKGRQQGLDTSSQIIEEAVRIRQRAVNEKEKTVREAEHRIVEIILEIAKKVLGEQVRVDKEAILGPVQKALEKCSFSRKVTMRVAPEDYETVSLSKNKLMLEMEGVSEFEIMMENTLSPGSCVLETEAGYINSGVEVQLERIEKCFKELLTYEQTGP